MSAPLEEQGDRTQIRRDYWYLCFECGVPTPAGLWTYWRYEDDGDELVPCNDGDAANRCPVCQWDHRDDDSGGGFIDGTLADVAVERAVVADDAMLDYWADRLADVRARVLAQTGGKR